MNNGKKARKVNLTFQNPTCKNIPWENVYLYS